MSVQISSNNKRIAKNTIYLYIRMMVTMLVALYTTRIVLKQLGINDYGLYNVIGGFTSMLGFICGLLSTGISRFLSIGLGEGNQEKLRRIFGVCLSIQVIVVILIFIVGETLGLWFLNNVMYVQQGRLFAANCVFQCTLITAAISVIQIPYEASVVSHEHMHVYAYMSILDVTAKLLIVFLLSVCNIDRLILYALFFLCVSCLVTSIYIFYSISHFHECHLRLIYDKAIFKEMGSFVGWNSVGGIAYIAETQGVNLLINQFFTSSANASRGLAGAIKGIVDRFVFNFQTAVRPQIYKSYGQGDYAKVNSLVVNNAKFSAYLYILLGIPVFLECDSLAYIWLGQVPPHLVSFTRLTLIVTIFTAIDSPLCDGVKAVGNMKYWNILSCIVYPSTIIISWIALSLGCPPEAAFVIEIIQCLIFITIHLSIYNKYMKVGYGHFMREVLFKVFVITIVSTITPYFLYLKIDNQIIRFISVVASSLICTSLAIFCCGINKNLRERLWDKINFIK